MIRRYLVLFLVFSLCCAPLRLWANDQQYGVGLKAGISRLEGDWNKPNLSFGGSLTAFYRPFPYWAISGEVGLTGLGTGSVQDLSRIQTNFNNTDKFGTTLVPFEIQLRLYPLPFARVKPFGELGLGGLWFHTTYDGGTVNIDGHEQKNLDTVFKIGGGLEYPLNNKVSMVLGADFRYTLTDRLDQIKSGDENDGIISIWTGVMYHFPIVDDDDPDNDFVPQVVDADPVNPEDWNGYMDHDGKPENGVPEDFDYKKPLVKHFPVFRANEGQDLKIQAEIYSTTPLKSVTIMYRRDKEEKWNIARMEPGKNNIYKGKISKEYVNTSGLEYFVVAVTQDLKGMGYSGLPKRPIQVKIVQNASKWRLATGITTAIGWASALFMILRKQNN